MVEACPAPPTRTRPLHAYEMSVSITPRNLIHLSLSVHHGVHKRCHHIHIERVACELPLLPERQWCLFAFSTLATLALAAPSIRAAHRGWEAEGAGKTKQP